MLPFDESEQAMRTDVVAAQIERDVIVADGPEAATYLHGQVSQNIEQLGEGASAWTLLLEPNGRVTCWGRITRVGSVTYWIDTDPGAGEAALARLERFKLGTKATFELRAGEPTVALRGPALPSDDDLARLVAGSDAVIASIDWPASSGVDLLGVAIDAVAPVLEQLGIPTGVPAVVELERIEAGRPAMGAEFGEKTIPAETGVVDRSADFTKGCYVGQELVARIDSRGNNTPRTVHPVRLAAGAVPSPGDELSIGGEVVGVVTSASAASDHAAALASVKRGVEVPAEAVVTIGGGDVKAEIGPVHWC